MEGPVDTDERCDADQRATWQSGLVDDWYENAWRQTSQPAIDSDGRPHFLAADWYSGIDYLTQVDGVWRTERLSDLLYVNETAIAIAEDGVVHAVLVQFANESVSADPWVVVHWVHGQAGAWESEPIPIPEVDYGGAPSIQIGPDGEPIVGVGLGQQYETGWWLVARHGASGWQSEEIHLDPTGTTIPAFDRAGHGHLAVYGTVVPGHSAQGLAYQTDASGEWTSMWVDDSTEGGMNTQSPAISVGASGEVFVAYHDVEALGRASVEGGSASRSSLERSEPLAFRESGLAVEEGNGVVHEAGERIGEGLYYSRWAGSEHSTELLAEYDVGVAFPAKVVLGPNCCGTARSRPFILWFAQPDLVWASLTCP